MTSPLFESECEEGVAELYRHSAKRSLPFFLKALKVIKEVQEVLMRRKHLIHVRRVF